MKMVDEMGLWTDDNGYHGPPKMSVNQATSPLWIDCFKINVRLDYFDYFLILGSFEFQFKYCLSCWIFKIKFFLSMNSFFIKY